MITLPESSPRALDRRSGGRLLRGLAVMQRRTLVLGALTGIAWTLCEAAVPFVIGSTIQSGVVQHNGNALLTGCLVLSVLGLAIALTGLWMHRLTVASWWLSALRVQQAIGHHVADHGTSVAAATTTGEVIETVGSDASRIGDLFEQTARAIGAAVAYPVVTVVLLRLDLLAGLWIGIGLPVMTVVLLFVVRPLQSRERIQREVTGELTALGADTAAGLRVLRGIGGEAQFVARYRERSQQVRGHGRPVANAWSAIEATHVLLPGIFVVSLIWIGAHGVLSGRLSPGALITLYGSAAYLKMPLDATGEILFCVVSARVASGRVVAVLNRRQAAPGTVASQPMPPAGAELLDPVSGVTVTPGLFTALVSATPEQASQVVDRLAGLAVTVPSASESRSGTDTMASLAGSEAPGSPAGLPQQRRELRAPLEAVETVEAVEAVLAVLADAAGVLLGGVPLDRLPAEAVRARIQVNEAEPRLFSGTLRQQLDPFGRHHDDELVAALTAADAMDVLDALPDGLSTMVEERGRGFSGGQRQRLTLARAVLSAPEVLMLVEPTSAVDAHTEARLALRLRSARQHRTTLVTTASPLLLQQCDRVLFLRDGRVADEGTHHRLMTENAAYRGVVTRGEDEP